MKKRVTVYFIPLIIIMGIIIFRGFNPENLLTNDYDQINSVNVNYKNETKIYTMEKDKEVINKIYGSIVNTKVTTTKNPDEINKQTSTPAYTIEINYKNGSKDLVKSIETGLVIYRILDENGSWVGGPNSDLVEIVMNLK